MMKEVQWNRPATRWLAGSPGNGAMLVVVVWGGGSLLFSVIGRLATRWQQYPPGQPGKEEMVSTSSCSAPMPATPPWQFCSGVRWANTGMAGSEVDIVECVVFVHLIFEASSASKMQKVFICHLVIRTWITSTRCPFQGARPISLSIFPCHVFSNTGHQSFWVPAVSVNLGCHNKTPKTG